jgi:hypothetical protein
VNSRPKEDEQGATPVVVVTSRLARDRFGGDRAALGKSAVLSGAAYNPSWEFFPESFVSEISTRMSTRRSVKAIPQT